jgi:hypothetical protein
MIFGYLYTVFPLISQSYLFCLDDEYTDMCFIFAIGFGLVWFHGVRRHFQQYFSYIVAVSFIGGGNRRTRRKPPTCRKSLTNFIT